MPLVDYDSSSEESDIEQPQQHGTVAPTVETKHSADSIASFLPPPKNRQPQTTARARVLGAGIKNTINAQVAQNADNIVLPQGLATVTSLVPTSLRNKVNRNKISEPSQPTKIPNSTPQLNVFGTVKSRSRPAVPNDSKISIGNIKEAEDEDELMMDDEQSSSKRKLEPDSVIKEFNVSEFYDKNIELKSQGLLQENKRLHTVTNHKNQLSALVKNAKQDQELLQERFEQNKKARKERGDRYGW